MNKFLKISVIMLFVIALLITGGILMSKDKKPLHEQIAEYMFNSRALPKLEYCVEKYGEEFVLTDTGDVISTRFPNFQVYLEWSEENQTYQDNYIVYLRQHDLEEILTPVANDVFGECKLFAYGYSVCPPDFGKETTAIELLGVSEEYAPVVQVDIFTVKDPKQKNNDMQKFIIAIQNSGYSICVNVEYLSEANYNNINSDNHQNLEPLESGFYKYSCSVIILPDTTKWRFGGWEEGEG